MPQRVAIYARYSSKLQRVESIDDQLEVCRRYACGQGWTEAGVYADPAISGGSRFRPELIRLMRDAKAQRFDVVLCEGIDRLGRRLADLADIHDRLSFDGITLHALGLGEVNPVVLGVLGAVAQRQLVEIGAKTKRGQLGRVKQGKIPGGLAYGYEVIPPPPGAKESGDRRIVAHEAAIVRRIFGAFAHGSSPRAIARQLNYEGVAGPGGRAWGDTTIRGQVDRGTGILNNTLYVGQLSWDRCQYAKDPATGKRVARPVPKDKWEIQAVEHLRILPQDIWDKVKARQAQVRIEIGRDAAGNPLNRAHRQAFLFSGTLVCGSCGGAYAIIQTNRYGCSHRRAKGTCDNAILVDRRRIEARVLAGLKERLLAPDLVAEFVREFAIAQREQQKDAAVEQRRLKSQCDDVERKLNGIIKAIENGAWSDALNNRLTDLEREKATLRAALETAEDPIPVVLHPNAAALYRRKVEDLQSALNDPTIKPAAMEALKALFEKIVLTPDATQPDGLRVELHGALAAILRLGEQQRAGRSGDLSAFGSDVLAGRLSVVAGIGFEPMTFRL